EVDAAHVPAAVERQAGALVPSVCRKDAHGSSLSVEIHLPFMDMELRHEGRLHVLQTEQLLLVLHGHELFQWHIGGQEKRLVRLGELTGRTRLQLSTAAAVVMWQEDLLLAVALDEYLEVYQLPAEALQQSAQWQLDPIQEFALPGRLQQMHLLQPSQDQVLLLLNLNFTQSQSRLKTFEWFETYFNPVEELNLPAIRAFQVVGRQPHYIVVGRSLRGQTKLALTVYELETPSLHLRRKQSLTVQARHVLAARFRGRNCLIACTSSSAAACIFFRMVDGNFVVYRKHQLRELHFTLLAASRLGQLLVGARANGEVLVFNSHRLDCYSGFGSEPNPSGLFTHRNAQNETFVLLINRREPGTTLLRLVQLGGTNDTASLGASLEGNDDLSSVQLHRFEFENTINALRSLLLRRKQQLDAVHRLTQSLQHSTLSLEQPLHMRSGGHIDEVHVQGLHLRTPTQLQQRMEQLRKQYAASKRAVRSFGVGNASNDAGRETLKVRRLHVKNLVYHGELLPDYYLDASGPPILTIKGQLRAKQLHTSQLLTAPGNARSLRSLEDLQQQREHIVVQHLHVERINNVSWFDFYDSLFLPARDKQIEGRLIVQSRARVVNLETPLLNGLVVRQLFNLRQHQVIASNIFMSAFYVSKLDAKLINGLDFARDVVFRGTEEALIKTPVRIDQMSVSGDLIVANETQRMRQQSDQEEQQAGTSLRLQQYYTGKVTLKGSLTVNNLLRDTQATRLQLGNQSLRREDLHAQHMLLHAPQNLTTLEFGNAKVTTPALHTAHIAGHPVAEHLLSGSDQALSEGQKPLHIIFMDARVEGDIICRNYSSRLAELSKDAVRQGETATITGNKYFEAPLTVESLNSPLLNGLDASELVLKSQTSQNFTHLKAFECIVVKGNVRVNGNLAAESLNRLQVAQLLEPGYSLQRLELLDTPKLQQLNLHRLNGLAFGELLGNPAKQQQLLLHKQLIIEGNVRFDRELQLQTINDLHWDDYVARLVNANANTLISGCKSFHAPVLLSDALETPSINGLDLSALLDNTLLRTTPQSIAGSYTFARMTVGNLDVPGVNGVPASAFLDTRQAALTLHGDLYVDQLSINGSLHCALANDPLSDLDARLARLQQRPWRKLSVLGDALWPETEQTHTRLDYLRQHAVRRAGSGTQTIAGHVILHAPHLGSIQTQASFPGNLNFSFIASDALLRHASGEQLIRSPQEMLQPVRARSINLPNDCHFAQLNHIDLLRLNASLYRRSSRLPIEAQLNFVTAPNVDKLWLQGQVNGGRLEGVFQQASDAEWPPVRLGQLHLQRQLQLGDINGMNLEYLLQQRVPLRGANALELFGTLSFEDLVLGERAMLRTINGIPLQNVVYKHGRQLQSISGTKTFEQGIDLQGPVHIMRLNGRDLSESYQQSIFTDRDYSIDSLVLDGAVFQSDLLPEPRAMPLDASPGQLQSGQQLRQQLQQLEQQLRSSQGNHSKRLLYLDYEQQSFEAVWTEPAAGEALDFEAAIQPEPTGSCQLQELRAQLSRAQSRVHLANVSLASRLIRASSQQAAIHVKAQNYCNSPKFRARIQLSCRQELHTLGLRQHVEHLQLHEQTKYSLLLISTVEEVRVLRIDHANCSLSDWQSVQPAAGRLMRLIQLEDPRMLLLFSSALHQHLPAVAVHRLDVQRERFELLQLIEGDYDVLEVQHQQLLLSCHGCHRIDVHVWSASEQRFVALQQLRLEARIQQLLPLTVGAERHLLVLTMPGSDNFYLLSYGHIEGWQQRTYGHMGEVLWSWPLLPHGAALTSSASVMLLCGQHECRVVRALVG
ncbi:hypothetical protein KR222_002309, partial [Zaprionus bogoriensis]